MYGSLSPRGNYMVDENTGVSSAFRIMPQTFLPLGLVLIILGFVCICDISCSAKFKISTYIIPTAVRKRWVELWSQLSLYIYATNNYDYTCAKSGAYIILGQS